MIERLAYYKMSSIHYKFRSSLEYDTITFDGQAISLSDLREAIMTRKKILKTPSYTLEITNAQTKEGRFKVYPSLNKKIGAHK